MKFALKNYDAIAFDMEGTLADTIPTHHAARLQAFDKHGFGHITREQHELGPTYGSSTHDIIGGVLHAAGEIKKDGPFREHPIVSSVVKTKMTSFEAIAADGFEAIPGAVEFVRWIAAHFAGPLALVTSSPERFVHPFLKRYGLSQYFADQLIIGEETVHGLGLEGKPAADPYKLAMQRTQADRILVFEDTPTGVESAKKAGATVIALGFNAPSAKLFTDNTLAYPPDAFAPDYTHAKRYLSV